jgi:putative membrane-bound dehydrogenase-like protein
MKRVLSLAAIVSLTVPSWAEVPQHPKFGFPVYTNAASGRQLSGQHKPADNPAMSPSDAQKAFKVPPGFEVRLFASEPEVVNPVAMTWDDRGRLWVLELYEYPLGTKPGEKGRDRIKVLEDTDADGVADKVTVFADGMTLATGLLLGHGGVYVGEAPHLWFLQDTDGDGRADRKTELLTGFGLEDRHELLNGFTWGPDGQMYMTHGVFTISRAKDPSNSSAEPVLLTAGVARLDPKTKRFEVYAEGTSNPWGVDFDAKGNAFVSACVIDHLFHLTPGGLYQRQAGQAPFPFAYGDLPSIVDHKHHMAAYAGINIYQGNQWPTEWKGAALHGNIHQNALNIDRLTPKGSTFTATKWNDSGDFLTTKDGWFMPVSMQTGPDGAVWVMDWYDKYPCYQNANADPAGVDRERGRIWRVVWTGDQPGKAVPSRPDVNMDLTKLSSPDLATVLAHPNVWQRRTAQRILNERGITAFGPRELHVTTPVHTLLQKGETLDARLAALWTLHGTGLLDDGWLDEIVKDKEPAIRAWTARLTGERGFPLGDSMKRLAQLAEDPDPTVRLAVAVAARQFVSGSLTLDTPPKVPIQEVITGPILSTLFVGYRERTKNENDPTLEFLYWMAAEPIVAFDPVHAIGFYKEDGAQREMPFSGRLLRKIMRRACDLRDETMLTRAVLEFGKIPESATSALTAGLQGLIEGQRGKALVPSSDAVGVISRLVKSATPEVAKAAQQLGTLWGDASSLKAVLARINDSSVSAADRIAAIKSSVQQKSDDSRFALLKAVNSANPDPVRVEAVRALQQVGKDDTGPSLLEQWNNYTPAVRAAVAELSTTRWQWRHALLRALKDGKLKRGDIPPTVVRTLATAKDDGERTVAQSIFGKVQASSAEKLKLIAEKRKVVTSGPVDLAAGHEIAKKTCFICHKLYGEGAEVGPDLTGVGRSSLDALLHNVINPNEIIGQGYENVEIETKDDRQLSGRMVENTDSIVKLLLPGPSEIVVAKSDVKSLRITENSAMPEGLEGLSDTDFRNLIWYILAPPGDNRPLTEERRKELIGSSPDQAANPLPARDGESIALWAPGWQIDAPDFEGSPVKLPEFAGQRNVLMTHPFDENKPAAIVRVLTIPPATKASLRFSVAAHEKGDWELRVKADGELLHRQTVTHDGSRWQAVKLDLSQFAGRRVVLRLENMANNWQWEFAYWSQLTLTEGEELSLR